MIIINNGVPKSATTLVYQFQMDLINAASSANGLQAFKDRNEGWHWVPTVTDDILEQMLEVDSEYGCFVFCTHSPPEKNTLRLIEEFGAKLTCGFRDPRDNVLSMIDHGAKTRAGGDLTGAFEQIRTIQDGVEAVKWRAGIFEGWKDNSGVLMVKYEDLMEDKPTVLRHISEFCGLSCDEDALRGLVHKYDALNYKTHTFNKGNCYRWKDEMSPEDLAFCNQQLRDEIVMMGYSLEH